MAIVIKGSYSGYVVDVLQYLGESSGVNPEGVRCTLNDAWLIRVNSPLKGVHATRSFMGNIAADKYLLPIRPGDLQEQDETEKELTV